MLATIGSAALGSLDYNIGRTPKDIDLVGDYDSLVSYLKAAGCTSIYPIQQGKKMVGKSETTIYDCEIAWPGSTSEYLLNYISEHYENGGTVYGIDILTPSLDLLYALKMSHRFKKNNPFFLKTMKDIHWMREQGATITPELQELFEIRQKEALNYKHPSLQQGKDTFFSGDGVAYIYQHDDIHKAVMLYEKPAYEYYKPAENEVQCSKDLFFKQPLHIQLAGVYEEAAVLALERSQIPYPNMDRKKSFLIALEKVCTSITSGWFREFSYENYFKIVQLYDLRTAQGNNYLDMFTWYLSEGSLKLYQA